ncbi:MAG TPA: AraC family transcriptional regulator [Verrucomicrobiae bacterium]|nr:AraC family transcriptional regulator [Verrucomicrobiae bacterium]
MSLHSRQLHLSPLVGVQDVHCRPETLACGCEECASRHLLVLPRRGAFVLHEDGKRAVVDTNQVTFFNAGHPHRISHLDIAGDDCTAVSFSDDLLDEVAGAAGVIADARGKRPFPAMNAPIGAAVALKSQVFFADLNHGDKSALTTEERAAELLRLAFAAIRPPRRATGAATNPTRARRTAMAAQEWVAARPFENWTLGELAGGVGSSPYHLLRLFRAETGSTIHQYRMQLRLTAAARTILDGCDDLTGLALDLGFSSHSHFTDAFRRRFGMAPSALRARTTGGQRAALRKNSTAPLRPIR